MLILRGRDIMGPYYKVYREKPNIIIFQIIKFQEKYPIQKQEK